MTVVTPRSGFDLEYYLNRTGGEQTGGGYYLNAAQQGEPDGRWFGAGAEALGLRDGQVVRREPYLAAYTMTDPRSGERLPGRAPGGYAKFADILARKLAAEPHATRERYLELEREAAQETRRSPVYTDVTVAHNKSVSVLHASFREQARRARLAGDSQGEALWRAREERVQEILQEANHAALEWMQEHAGFTRTGYHGTRVDGVEPGRWARALPVVTTWLQGTNRDGEPHDHSHNVIARMALTEADGIWRAVDTMALRAQLGAMAAIVESRVYSALAREFGIRVRKREDGRGHEIDGIAQAHLDAYSTRAHAVTRTAAALARQWERKYGRVPNAREMLFITDEANLASREGKVDEPIDWDALTAKWDATIGGQLAAIAEKVCDFGATPDETPPSPEVQSRVIEEALARVQASRSTWTRSDLMRSIAWSMGQEFCGLAPAARQDLLEQMTERALGVDYGVVCLEAPEWPPVPRSLIRDLDGRSVYTRPGTTRYATRGQLAMEERMCQQAQRYGAPALTRGFCATQLGADADVLDAQLGARAQDATAVTQTGLRMDQAAMIYEALSSGRRVSVGVGPAGSGKTHAAAAGARAWEANGGTVIGLTCAQAAKDVLAAAGIDESYNTSRFLLYVEQGMPVRPGTLFVVDEGSMVSMAHLAKIIDLAEKHGGKVFLTGDHEQLAAVESGGGMSMLAGHLGHTQLAVPVRFTQEWERDASLRLRAGDKTALDAYAERLAYTDPAWTPGHGPHAPVRPPQELAPAADDFPHVIAAVHHAAEAIALLAEIEHEQLHQAVRAWRILVPTRTLSDRYDIPRPYALAPAERTSPLLARYRDTTRASRQTTTAIGHAARAARAPSLILATAREAIHANPHPSPGKDTGDARASARHEQAPHIPRPLQQTLINRGNTDPAMLARGAGLDQASEQLLADAAVQLPPPPRPPAPAPYQPATTPVLVSPTLATAEPPPARRSGQPEEPERTRPAPEPEPEPEA